MGGGSVKYGQRGRSRKEQDINYLPSLFEHSTLNTLTILVRMVREEGSDINIQFQTLTVCVFKGIST